MAKIFISYRREDSGFAVDQLHGALKPYVDNPSADIFIDVDNIPPGVDFVEHLDKKVAQCEVMLVAIGQRWLDATDPDTGARRLDNPDDFVRIEITRALARNIPVVPVLIGGAEMPPVEALPDDLKPLARRQATPIGRGRVEEDVADLAYGLGLKKTEAPQPKGKGGLVAALLGLVVLGGGAAGVWVLDPFSGGETDSPSGPAPIETAKRDATAEPEEDVTIFEDDTAQGPAADVPTPSEEPDAESVADAETRAAAEARAGPWDNISQRDWSVRAYEDITDDILGQAGLTKLKTAADAGNQNASTVLGMTYHLGKGGLSEDHARAAQYYRIGCDRGNMRGCNNLGYMYLHALGVTQDYARARQLSTKACDCGDMVSCNDLGYMYQLALGVTQDYTRARQLYTKACYGGEIVGCGSLGYMYQQALGVTQDYTRARQLFTKACDGGNERACQNLKNLGDRGR